MPRMVCYANLESFDWEFQFACMPAAVAVLFESTQASCWLRHLGSLNCAQGNRGAVASWQAVLDVLGALSLAHNTVCVHMGAALGWGGAYGPLGTAFRASATQAVFTAGGMLGALPTRTTPCTSTRMWLNPNP